MLAVGGCLQCAKAPPADEGGQVTLIHGPQLSHDISCTLLRFLLGAAAAAGHTELAVFSAPFMRIKMDGKAGQGVVIPEAPRQLCRHPLGHQPTPLLVGAAAARGLRLVALQVARPNRPQYCSTWRYPAKISSACHVICIPQV